MTKGTIILNRYDLTNEIQAKALKNNFEKLGVKVDIVKNSFDIAYFKNNQIFCSLDVDFVIFLDKDILLAKLLEEAGIRVFNTAKCLEICDDKFLTSIYLARDKINIPNTYSLPLEYKAHEVFIKTIDFPFVLKVNKSSLGEGVFLIKSENDFIEAKKQIGTSRAIIQEYISSSSGKDIRVIVLGGKILCAMERTNVQDFRSNISCGGIGSVCDLRDDFIEIAIKAARAVGADYCGVDILLGANNEPIVCEVNSNALFTHIEKITGINVAYHYAKYVVDSM